MLQPTRTQVMHRWDAVSDTIKEEIVSEINADFIWKTCETEHLPEEKKGVVARITGYVLLGFIHPEDLAKELADILKTNKQVADTVAAAINKRVFEPLKSELDETYEPLSGLAPLAPPKPLEDVKKPEPSLSVPPRFTPPPLPPKPPMPTASVTIPAGPPTPFGSAIPRPAAPPPFGATPSKPFVPFSQTPTTLGKTTEDKEPAPKIIQEEVEFKPLRQQSGFGINIPMPKSLDATVEKERVPARPAVLEFGNSSAGPLAAKQGLPTNAELGNAPRVVHYSEYRTPVDTSPSSGQAGQSTTAKSQTLGRDVQEVTALPSSAPPAPRSYGSTSRPPVSVPTPPSPAPIVPALNRTEPPRPPVSIPRFSDVLLNEKELPPGKT